MTDAFRVSCVDTLVGPVHRFPSPDGPCQCGAVIRNRRETVRLIPQRKSRKTLGVLNAFDHPMTITDVESKLHESKDWLKHAVLVLIRAKKLVRVGTKLEPDPRGYQRSVAIYDRVASSAYPEGI